MLGFMVFLHGTMNSHLLELRVLQGISCADVADVCVKALHEPSARNKSFDVSTGSSMSLLMFQGTVKSCFEKLSSDAHSLRM